MGKRFALGAAIIVVLSTAAVATAALLEFNTELRKALPHGGGIEVPHGFLPDVAPGKPQTILVLGSDRRYGDKKKGIPARSDTILLVRLDPQRHATAVMSVPRDLVATIPGHGLARINSAYGDGGPKLSAATVKSLGIEVNHIVNIDFHGFQLAINRLGCAYVDVDRRYFNDNHPPVASTENYATIDIKPGYQRLCGSDSLDFVRFRHLDDDFVRAARQQDFLRQLKAQFGVGQLFNDRTELLRIFGHYVQTDLARLSDAKILGFLKLVYDAAQSPVTEVHFPTGKTQKDQSIVVPPAVLQRAVHAFEAVRGPKPPRAGGPTGRAKRPRRAKRGAALAAGLVVSKREGEDEVLNIATHLSKLPVYFPKVRLARGGYAQGGPRAYRIKDRGGGLHDAYRITLWQGEAGQYYGIQGTTWAHPPILEHPTDTVRLRRRTYQRYFDGKHLRLIAWHGPNGWYWVSNTLSSALTNGQMMDIARSLQRIGQ